MGFINRYTLFCTEAQTRKALELGAPLFKYTSIPNFAEVIEISTSEYYEIPTAEQLIGWLEEQEGVDFSLKKYEYYYHSYINEKYIGNFKTRKEATLAAIDAALEYLTKNKK